MANLTRFVLTAPARGPVFDRIEAAYNDLDGFIALLKDKDLYDQHFEAVRADVEAKEAQLSRVAGELSSPTLHGLHKDLRAYRIYFRALLLQKLDELDAWQPKAKKDRAK